MAGEPSKPTLLSIAAIGTRYRLQRARFDLVATYVAERVAGTLRAEGIRHLLSFRSKHPDDVIEKVARKRAAGKPDYDHLGEDLNAVIHDLAGVRVVVYDPQDEWRVADALRKDFRLAEGPPDQVAFARPPYKERGKMVGYSATHLIVAIDDGPDSSSIAGARCEVQICNVAAHLFNELEHDIGYKKHKATPTAQTMAELENVRLATRALEDAATALVKRHSRDIRDQSTELLDAVDLAASVRATAGRDLRGDFQSLFLVLRSVLSPFTIRAIEGADQRRPTLAKLREHGEQVASRLEINADDATCLALGLSETFRDEFRAVVDGWDAERTPLVDALARATHDD